MNDWLIYFCILAVYLPGLLFALFSVKAAQFPIVTFYFLGLFSLNALGSIYVLLVKYSYGGVSIASTGFVQMLLVQVVLFYVVASPYMLLNRQPPRQIRMAGAADPVFVAVIFFVAIGLVVLFYRMVGSLLLFDLLGGNLNAKTALGMREQKSTGVEGFLIFRFGFLVIPALSAGILTLISLIKRRLGWVRGLLIFTCLLIPLMLADKAGVLRVALNIFIAYILYQGTAGRTVISSINIRVLLVAIAVFIPTILIISSYYGGDNSLADNLRLLAFRIFGAHSEALAGVVPYVQAHGLLNGATLPNFHGIFPHERLIIENTMHPFLTGLPGKIPVSATAEGYVNFGWPGFALFSVASTLIVIGTQELLGRLNLGLLGGGWIVWYAYLAMMLATNSLFSTFISFTYVLSVVLTVMLYAIVKIGVDNWILHRQIHAA